MNKACVALFIEKVRAQLADALSPMGDFSHAMTVRHLVDLQPYLCSVK
jgi:hypothetical protein